ncbi:hypothetical protein METBIDRAFT_148747 [Metschnikowia bicuspidata var. bicuspidata NRRL YB-4993]|uniref:Actin binding protein n=1 Tax=Metschnikowia bicuspidata var. bicuspidata NRRL YB-4993 TaxID=869754 RepID=A0A1A0HE98_9ASCO|nr:hypothetical protein METBIDRAFT_148747 [Metschnikowia bicuspidata var. bicuspidata NRRL YB-4993]OBA22228.1 hypothetical protein METBIDRAFT_148747 [Metschnikowia bicuspidata var. bicuspidata NRRL YB-4993]
MEKVDFSKNAKEINDLYTKVVRGDAQTSFAVFTVNKNNVLDATASGTGDLYEFVEAFSDGIVQFGLARVTVPGSDVSKNVLLGWCPDNAPVKLRLSFAPTFVEVARIFAGYHIQITARDPDDLDVDEIISKVSAAAGARYTYHANGQKGATMTKPVQPKSLPVNMVSEQNPVPNKDSLRKPKPMNSFKVSPTPVSASADDGWGDEEAIEERDFNAQPLENVPSAYVPTKVNIKELRNQKSDTISSHKDTDKIAEKYTHSDNHERIKLLHNDKKLEQLNKDERLTALPKPKISNSVSARYLTPRAESILPAKPSFGSRPIASAQPSNKSLPEGLFQNHANENGLTPAQAWAQKRGKYSVEPKNDDDEPQNDLSNLSINEKNGEWTEEALTIPKEIPAIFKRVPDEPSHFVEDTISPQDTFEEVEEPSNMVLNDNENNDENIALDDDKVHEQIQNETAGVAQGHFEAKNSKLAESRVISAVAQYDYDKDEDNEVSFKEGDAIIEIEFVDEEWWSGKNSRTGENGVFPGSYVTLDDSSLPKDDDETVPDNSLKIEPERITKSNGRSAIAEYDYEKEEDNEIGFREGDLIVDIEFVDEDWWSGKHSVSGEVGVFPGNFVSLQ